MNRLTRLLDGTFYAPEEFFHHNEHGYSGEVVSKLAIFENIYDDLLIKQEQIVKELEKLRSECKANTVKFKQLLVKKISNNNMLILFETYGLK